MKKKSFNRQYLENFNEKINNTPNSVDAKYIYQILSKMKKILVL